MVLREIWSRNETRSKGKPTALWTPKKSAATEGWIFANDAKRTLMDIRAQFNLMGEKVSSCWTVHSNLRSVWYLKATIMRTCDCVFEFHRKPRKIWPRSNYSGQLITDWRKDRHVQRWKIVILSWGEKMFVWRKAQRPVCLGHIPQAPSWEL